MPQVLTVSLIEQVATRALFACLGARRGILQLPGVEEDVGMVGIHWRGQFIELVPWNGEVQAGTFPQLSSKDLNILAGLSSSCLRAVFAYIPGHAICHASAMPGDSAAPVCSGMWRHGAAGESLRATVSMRHSWRRSASLPGPPCGRPQLTQGWMYSAGTPSMDR